MKWKGVLFDLDGTIADTSEGIMHAVEYTIDQMGLHSLSEEKIRSFIGPPIYESLKNEYMLNDDDTKKATDIFRNAYKEKFLYEARVYDGIEELLDNLKSEGIKLGVATNKREDYALMLIEQLGLATFFDNIQGSDYQNTLRKREIIELCLAKLNLQKSEAVLVGDTIHDYEGAKQSGVDFVAVSYGFGFHNEEERKFIDNPCMFGSARTLMEGLQQDFV